MSIEQIKTPDIGGESGEIIEILVEVGDQVEEEQSLVVLESAKASMEVPSPKAGKVAKLYISVGDNLEEGNPILDLELASDTSASVQDKDEETETEEDSSSATEPAQSASVESESEQKPAEASKDGQSHSQLIKVPDIGSDSAEIIELSVEVGDRVRAGDTLVVAESEKASMDIPIDSDGHIDAIHVKVGDQISEGQDLVTIIAEGNKAESEPETSATEPADVEASDEKPDNEATNPEVSEETERLLQVPDLGSESAAVIEVAIKAGDNVKEGDTLVVAESDKASLEIPAEIDGEILKIHCAVGDQISQGSDLATIKSSDGRKRDTQKESAESTEKKEDVRTEAESPAAKETARNSQVEAPPKKSGENVYAGPAVRKLAREFGIELSRVAATGPRGRILKGDLHNFVKSKMKESSPSGTGLPKVADVDWTKFGSVRTEATSKIHRLTAENMQRSWLNVPHVTQFDDADVSELEQYRALIRHEGIARGIKMTPLAFILKASCKALKNNPKFNAALSVDATSLVFRDYFHIGVAVDTPAGLMVPVVRDVDTKDIWQLASEIAELADKAKNSKLKPAEMQGACFTVSSLGAIGGRGFTPIVPAPQVAILGVSKTSVQPVWDGEKFEPRQLMPLALSYDHRAVNGADAGRFLTYLADQLGAVENIWSD